MKEGNHLWKMKKLNITKVNQTKNFVSITLSKELTKRIDGELLFLDVISLTRKFRFSMKNDELTITLDIVNLDKHFIYYLIDMLDILKRALKIFDKVVVLVAVNPTKNTLFSVDERVDIIKKATEDMPNVSVDSTYGLTSDYALKIGSNCLIRGLRAVSDFEYELQLSAANKYARPDIEEIFFMADSKYDFISSTNIKVLYKNNVDISALVPAAAVEAFKKK